MKRAKRLTLITLLALALSPAAAAQRPETADGLVFDAIGASQNVTYTGVVESYRDGERRSETSVYRVEHRAPDLTARFYSAPGDLKGDEVITEGTKSYSIDVRRRRVVVSENQAADDDFARNQNYILMRANYIAVTQATETFDGRLVDDVALLNKYTHSVTLLVRIDEVTKLVLDKRMFARDGALVSEVRFESVRYVASLPPSDFQVPGSLTRVAGPTFGDGSGNVTRTMAASGFASHEPTFLPEGFAPVQGKLVSIRGVRTLHLLYSDGIRTVSLFENDKAASVDMDGFHPQPVTVAGHNAQYAHDGHTTLLAWDSDGMYYALVGDLDLNELEKIAASVQ